MEDNEDHKVSFGMLQLVPVSLYREANSSPVSPTNSIVRAP